MQQTCWEEKEYQGLKGQMQKPPSETKLKVPRQLNWNKLCVTSFVHIFCSLLLMLTLMIGFG